jgi:DNA-binding MarR family transcriptional regulator
MTVMPSKSVMDNAIIPAVRPGGLAGQIGFALRRAQAAVLADFQRRMEGEDIRAMQFAVLQVLRHNPGLRQTQVSVSLGIKTTNFVPLFDALERRGLAERRSIAGDRRAKGLFLTHPGAETLERLERIAAEHEAHFTARIGPDGKAQLLGLLNRLADPA